MKRKSLILPILLWISIFTSGCINLNTEKKIDNNETWEVMWLANPASVYCEENWWTLEMIFDNWESYGMCHFQNGSTCEEREFYRKECFPVADKTWNKQNINWETNKTVQESNKEKSWNINTSIWNEKESSEKTDTQNTKKDWSDMTVCTMDAKQCPDWSYVSRSWQDCEFAKCPTEKQNNKSIDEIINNHQESSWYQEEWLTEDDIDLMEQIIDKLK